MSKATNPLDTQVGGDHYKTMKIQPFEFSMANNFNAGQHSIVKYVSRYKNKNQFEDLKKAHHFLELMMSHEYPEAFQAWKQSLNQPAETEEQRLNKLRHEYNAKVDV